MSVSAHIQVSNQSIILSFPLVLFICFYFQFQAVVCTISTTDGTGARSAQGAFFIFIMNIFLFGGSAKFCCNIKAPFLSPVLLPC